MQSYAFKVFSYLDFCMNFKLESFVSYAIQLKENLLRPLLQPLFLKVDANDCGCLSKKIQKPCLWKGKLVQAERK